MPDPENKRLGGRGSARVHSGRGSESVRPLLRAQLAQRDLVRETFPPPDDEGADGKGQMHL